MKLRIPIFSLTVLLLLSHGWAAQETDLGPPLWTEVVLDKQAAGEESDWLPNKYALFSLDREALTIVLEQAPMEFVKAAASLPVIELPAPDGKLTRFLFEESPILSEKLSLQYPEIRTYRAHGLDDPTLTTRFDLTSSGFHAMIFSTDGTWLIDPHPGGDDLYMVYRKRDAQTGEPFRCLVEDSESAVQEPLDILAKISPNNPSGTELRTYRLAVTSTDEYWVWADGIGSTAANQISTTFNRVTGIYERDLAISFVIVCLNIYDNDPPGSDPFINDVNGTLLDDNNDDLNSTCGSGNYDLGHLVSQGGGGGLAACGACRSNKGRGATSRGNPRFDTPMTTFTRGASTRFSPTGRLETGAPVEL